MNSNIFAKVRDYWNNGFSFFRIQKFGKVFILKAQSLYFKKKGVKIKIRQWYILHRYWFFLLYGFSSVWRPYDNISIFIGTHYYTIAILSANPIATSVSRNLSKIKRKFLKTYETKKYMYHKWHMTMTITWFQFTSKLRLSLKTKQS